MRAASRAPRRVALAFTIGAAAVVASACASSPSDDERTRSTNEPLTAYCEANVSGKMVPTETDYLPHVVHCENGGAPPEALKVQAIAARTYLYYKMETSGHVTDGQGDQVYSCGSAPTAAQIQAVKDTEGLVLRYKSTTIAAFFVAGGAASPPSCHGASGGTESDVTYNAGLSGNAVHQTPLGSINPANLRNRGCMSQLGSRCLADEGKTYDDILHFYYGADIVIERATGPCVTAVDADGGSTSPPSGDAATPGAEAGPTPDETADVQSSEGGCATSRATGGGLARSSGAPRQGSVPTFAALVAGVVALVAARRRRGRRFSRS